MASVATVRLLVASTVTVLPFSAAVPITSVVVAPLMLSTASAAPTAVPDDEPAEPSAVDEALTVFDVSMVMAPVDLRFAEPPMVTVAVLSSVVIATAASEDALLLLESGAADRTVVSDEPASMFSVPPAVIVLAPVRVTALVAVPSAAPNLT